MIEEEDIIGMWKAGVHIDNIIKDIAQEGGYEPCKEVRDYVVNIINDHMNKTHL